MSGLSKKAKGYLVGAAALASTALTPLQAEEANTSHSASNSHAASFNNVAPDTERNDGVAGHKSMQMYAEDPNIRGFGIFINLDPNSHGEGKIIGDDIVGKIAEGYEVFNEHLEANGEPKLRVAPAEYRFNEANSGGQPSITIYMRDKHIEFAYLDAVPNIFKALRMNEDLWLHENRVLYANNTPAPSCGE